MNHAFFTFVGLVVLSVGRSLLVEVGLLGEEVDDAVEGRTLADADLHRERLLGQAVQGGAGASAIEPGLADTLLRETAAAAQRQDDIGLPAVLLVPGPLRWSLSRFLRRAWSNLSVLANAEIPEARTIKVTTIIGAKQ